MDRDTRYFTVFGGSYVPERHHSNYCFEVDRRRAARNPSAAASWVVFATLVAGISVFAVELSRFTTGAHIWLQ